jgi:hypothetical protein
MLPFRADQHTVPLPAAGLCRLDEHQHHALVEVRGKPSEHPLGEEGRAPGEGLEDPLVVERLHAPSHVLERYCDVSSAAMVLTAENMCPRRMFSLSVCWLLSKLTVWTRIAGAPVASLIPAIGSVAPEVRSTTGG